MEKLDDAREVVIYTAGDCYESWALRRFLDRHGIPYREVDVRDNPVGRAELAQRAGVRVPPVTCVGERAFYGTFRDQPPGIVEALGLDTVRFPLRGEA